MEALPRILVAGVPGCVQVLERMLGSSAHILEAQTAVQRRPDGGLVTEGRRVGRSGAGGDKLIGLLIDLEELRPAPRQRAGR